MGELMERWRFWSTCDRIGPDIPLSHWRLYFPRAMERLCAAKFRRFGQGAEFRPGAYAVTCSKISLGAKVVIRPQTMLMADPRDGDGHIVIEDEVLMGSNVQIYTANHRYADPGTPIIYQGHERAQDVIVRRGAWIGAGVIILPGVEIGRNAVIAAGSVVTRSIPETVVAAGAPAKVVRRIAPDLKHAG
jgi:acetyltransferase-like isoleucine patch superfamily enzyme